MVTSEELKKDMKISTFKYGIICIFFRLHSIFKLWILACLQ